MPKTTDITGAKRILVYGVCGSGKTTLAANLSRVTGLPWHSVDDLAWLPGWVTTTEEFQRETIEKLIAADSWILDTAYGKWLELPLSKTDVIVALDYPRWFSFQRLLKRTLARMIDKKPICNGNVETLRNMLSRDSILLWHFRSFRRKRDRIRAWAAATDGPQVVLLRSARLAEQWLGTIPRDKAS